VRKLELSNAPDEGIQYHRETIFFDQNVKEMRRFKQSNEDRVTTQTMF